MKDEIYMGDTFDRGVLYSIPQTGELTCAYNTKGINIRPEIYTIQEIDEKIQSLKEKIEGVEKRQTEISSLRSSLKTLQYKREVE